MKTNMPATTGILLHAAPFILQQENLLEIGAA